MINDVEERGDEYLQLVECCKKPGTAGHLARFGLS